ncbi:transcriptional regulator [Halogeometricum borinquense DSM 11551]|uniref:Transcriptional regulator n=2 Tax=Halogeometricum borinquense TaxID=60847 RepID=E4NKR8_HALBP|nr:Lrp/AsnC family transcriptional regulator [Halogeometricum borinquense]ADQ65964.1 transcriptional regulator [Halogeometricum borinquense DSM 11551]ELY23120.1 transcriptional regulator [Halogeometricum borinquense DSM 11551]RYJ08517.1 Lrp/AsnC family transcriptional regulator [Halogeometricum borinquense]
MGDRRSQPTTEWLENEKVKRILTEYLDETDYRIYKELNRDGRISDTELGERVGLSRTAARRRREKLQSEGLVDVLGVLVLQEAELAYADAFVTLNSDISQDDFDDFLSKIEGEELIYEIDEYMGKYDLLLRVWHASLSDIKSYLRAQLQTHDAVERYETVPVTKTHKAWHKILSNSD